MRVQHPLLDALAQTPDRGGLLRSRVPFVAVVDDVLDRVECDSLIARIESLAPAAAPITVGRDRFEMRPDIRNNDRVMFDDVSLAASLWTRLREVPPTSWLDDGRRGQRTMTACGLNERFRGYRYSPGHRFAPHFDGAYWRHDDEGSMLTLLLYLNDGYGGGGTALLDWDFTLHPRRGQALLFYHPILHEGQMVESGTKYVLRSDVMYRASPPPLPRPGAGGT